MRRLLPLLVLVACCLAPAWVNVGDRGCRHPVRRRAVDNEAAVQAISRNDLRKIIVRGGTLALAASLFVPEVRKMDGYLWYIAQVDRFNPDNTPNLPEAELMAKAGEIAKQAGDGLAVDLGAGSGNDLRYLQATGLQPLRVLGVEPNRFTWPQAESQAQDVATESGAQIDISFAADISEVPSESASLLLGKRVLCSVDDELATVKQIFRVLKPGGVFAFIEHVAAEPGSGLRTLQDVFRPVQLAFANNCDMVRDTESILRTLPWSRLELENYDEAWNGPLSPHIRGIAVKPLASTDRKSVV